MPTIMVHHNDVECALRLLKRQTQKSGLLRELRRRQQYEKPVWSNNSYPPFLSRLRPAIIPFGRHPFVLRSLLLTRLRLCLTIGSHVDDICG
jgi:ribosomal protein S21